MISPHCRGRQWSSRTVTRRCSNSTGCAEEWTYRYLAAAHAWVETEQAVSDRIGIPVEANETTTAPETAPSTAEVRAWARAAGIAVPDRGRLHPDIWHAWRDAQPQ